MPELDQSKDVVAGVLAAATALTGFMLVFLALALSTIQRDQSDTRTSVVRVYRRAAGLAFLAFILGVAVIGLALLWLRGRSDVVYSLISWLFAGELLLVTVSAGLITWSALRR